MKTFFVIGIMIAALAGCDKGLHTGELKDCAGIPPNQREDAARAIKGLSGEKAAEELSTKFNISLEAARQCVK